MVKIRLRRIGAKKRPFYRIVVADSRTARNGRFIESVGTYDPNQDPPVIKVERERIEYWLGIGAQPSDTTRGLLKKQGFLGGVVEKKAEPKKSTKATKAAKAAEKKTEELVAEKAEEPIVEKIEEPVVEKAEEPVAEKVEEPVVEKTEEPAAESAE